MKKFKRAVALSCLSFVCVCHANRYWSNKVDWDFANPENWMRGKTTLAEIAFNGSETVTDTYDPQLVLDVAGHYCLHEDLTVLRAIADTSTNNKKLYFDFDSDSVFTLRGMSNGTVAFGMNGGQNILYALTGGTFLVPEIFCSSACYASCISIPRGSGPLERTTNVTFAVYNRPGATAALKTPKLRLNWGVQNVFVVSNNAEAVIGTLELGEGANALSNGVLVASGGSFSLTNATGILKLGGASTAHGIHFTVADGGRLSGIQAIEIEAGSGHLLAFRGASTDVTMTSTAPRSYVYSSGSRLEVTDGAKFRLAGTQGRVWIGKANAGQSSNMVVVAGTGSRFISEGTGSFLGANANTGGHGLVVSNNAYAEFRRFHLGQHANCNGNMCRVESGGVLVDLDPAGTAAANGMVVGFGENKVSVMSNVMVVATGGIVSNCSMTVGSSENSYGNVLEIDAGTMYTSGAAYIARAGTASRLTVKNEGLYYVGKTLTTAQGDNLTNALGVALSREHRIEVLSGGCLDVSAFLVRGTNHVMTVSNGMVRVRGVGGFQLPYFTAGDDGTTLVIAGTNPVIRSETPYNQGNYALAIRRSAKIKFVVPQEGYVTPPLQTSEGRLGLFNDLSDVPCEFDVSGCSPYRRVSTVIAEAGNGAQLYIPDTWLLKTRAALPEGARLVVSNGKLRFSYGNDATVLMIR